MPNNKERFASKAICEEQYRFLKYAWDDDSDRLERCKKAKQNLRKKVKILENDQETLRAEFQKIQEENTLLKEKLAEIANTTNEQLKATLGISDILL